MRLRRSTATVVLVLNACYSAVPLTSNPPSRGTDLIITLTDTGSTQLASVIGPKATGLGGRYLSESGDTLFLGVSSVSQQGGNEQFWKGERIGVPRPSIATIRERKASTAKSALVVGALVAILVGITSIVASGSTGSQGGPPPKGQ
jgi:hypothetical protein